MSNEPIETVGHSLVASFGSRLVMVAGECAEHGQANALVRAGSVWHCPACFEGTLKADTDAKTVGERTAWLRQVARLPERYVGVRFVAGNDEQRAVRQTVKMFQQFILSEAAWAALIMVGKTGTGKTLLACELAQSLMTKAARSVRYITAKGMISEIQASYSNDSKSEEGEIMRFSQYDVLIIDEIDALPAKENASLLLTEIINRRYNENKPVIVISNQPFDNLAKFIGERVHSRLHENAFSCDFSWADFRRAQVAA